MYKIAIVGCENSHADQFLGFIRDSYPDIEVAGVYSDEREEADKLHEKYGVPVMEHYADAVGRIDGLINTARHGKNHRLYCEPYLPSGIPMFVDKPIAVSVEDAALLMREAKRCGVRLSGGSSCDKTDTYLAVREQIAAEEAAGKPLHDLLVDAPLSEDERYGGFWFYSQHGVQMLLGLFPGKALTVDAVRGENGWITYTVGGDRINAVGILHPNAWGYHVAAYTGEHFNSWQMSFAGAFEREFRSFYDLLCGAPMATTYAEFMRPVTVLDAIERSLAEGRRVAIADPGLDF